MSAPEIAVRTSGLSKAFRIYTNKWYRLQSALTHSGNHSKTLWALKDINIEVPRGTTLGVIGQNGAGKTTFLQLLAGLLKPTDGEVQVTGNVATLLELGAGFQYELSGRENIFFSCGLRGFSRSQVARRIDEIIAFAELEQFIDQPIQHYSSGMLLRLAFATAIHVQPDVLLVDEIFSVGDAAFQHKCANKFRELQSNGTTIVLATHDMAAVKSLCHAAMLLDAGKMVMFGHPADVSNLYLKMISERIAQQQTMKPSPKQPTFSRHGSGEAQILSVQVFSNSQQTEIVPFGEEVTFRFLVHYFADIPESILGFYIRDQYGNDLIGINTHEEGKRIGPMRKGEQLEVEFTLPLYLRPGSYSVSPGLAYHPNEMQYLDWINHAVVLQIQSNSNQKVHGFFWVPNEITIRKL